MIDKTVEDTAAAVSGIRDGATVMTGGFGRAGQPVELIDALMCHGARDSWVFDGLYRAGEIELELAPQGNLTERLRAAGEGIGAFFSPTGVDTQLAGG